MQREKIQNELKKVMDERTAVKNQLRDATTRLEDFEEREESLCTRIENGKNRFIFFFIQYFYVTRTDILNH